MFPINIPIKTLILYSVTTYLAFIQFFRGIRLPNNWSYTHFLFNYDLGFIKRGLLGQMFKLFQLEIFRSYEFFSLFSFMIIALNIGLILKMIFHFINYKNYLLGWISACLLATPAFIIFFHTIGYLDHLCLLIVLGIIHSPVSHSNHKFFFIIFASIFMTLIHEGWVLLFFPIILLSLLNKENIKHSILKILSLTIILVFVVFITGSFKIDNSKALNLQKKLESELSVSLRDDAFQVATRGLDENLIIMKNFRNNSIEYKNQFLKSFRIFFPAYSMIVLIFVFYLFHAGINIRNAFTFLSLMTAVFSPILLNLLAWDMHRFNSIAIVNAIIILYLNSQFKYLDSQLKTDVRGKFVFFLAILGITYYINLSIPLFDGFQDRRSNPFHSIPKFFNYYNALKPNTPPRF